MHIYSLVKEKRIVDQQAVETLVPYRSTTTAS